MLPSSLIQFFLLLVCSVIPATIAQQTLTVPDPDVPGGSIVEVITLDPNDGTPVTQIVSSIAAVLPETTPVLNPGPVAAPPSTTIPVGEGTTKYEYTTIVDGETEVLTDFFTPTFNTLPPAVTPTSGSILALSDWTALVGTNTVGVATGSAESWRVSRAGLTSMVAVTVGLLAGAYVIL